MKKESNVYCSLKIKSNIFTKRAFMKKKKTTCVPRDICIKGTIKLAKSSNHTHTTFTLSSFVVFLCLILSNELRTGDTVTQNAAISHFSDVTWMHHQAPPKPEIKPAWSLFSKPRFILPGKAFLLALFTLRDSLPRAQRNSSPCRQNSG